MTVACVGAVDFYDSAKLRAAVRYLLDRGDVVALDLSRVTCLDLVGVALLEGAVRFATTRKITPNERFVLLAGPNAPAQRVLRARYGNTLGRRFHFVETAQEASAPSVPSSHRS